MRFNFADRFQAAFGFVATNVASRLIQQKFGDVVKEGNNYNLSVFADKEGAFDELELYYHDTTRYFFSYRSVSEETPEVFATPPMLSLRRAKRLVITPIDNSDIEVVERYGTEPWEITMRGLLIDMENHEFPLGKMEKLASIFNENREWDVASEILNSIGVDSVYFKDIDIEFVEGYEDTIAYTMTARSIKSQQIQLMGGL